MNAKSKNGLWVSEKIPFVAAIALYAACWFLPIIDGHIGFDGAREAHTAFWRLLIGEYSPESPTKVFEIIFISLGWLANELFVLSVIALRINPRLAFRSIVFSFGIMISWLVAMLGETPLLVGFWFWVASGATMFYFAANFLSRKTGQPIKAIVTEPTTLTLLMVPIVNAGIGLLTGMKL